MASEGAVQGTEEQAKCACPFCEGMVEMSAPWCVTCGVQVRFCAFCEEPLPEEAKVCPSCGKEHEG